MGSPINTGAAATSVSVNQFYLWLTGGATEATTLKQASNSVYALTILNTGTGGAIRVRNSADGANLFTIGESTTEILNDFKAHALATTGGLMGVSPYLPKVKVIEVGSASTPLSNYTNYAPHTVYIMDADNPVKTAIWIESVDDSYTTATGAQQAGSDLKQARVNPAIYIQHFAHKDNGFDSSAMSIMEWGQANNLSLISSTRSVSQGGRRPDSIDASNITLSRGSGFNLEVLLDGGPRTGAWVAQDGNGNAMLIGVGWQSTTAGDNTPTREYSDGIRIYPHLGAVDVITGVLSSDTGTATAGASLTLTDSGKAWTVNIWGGYIVRITGGTGSGQERKIASNTATVLTVTEAWTTNPDATSTYEINTWQDQRAAIRVGGGTLAPAAYLNKYDTFRVMLDGKVTIASLRATGTTPGSFEAGLRMLQRENTSGDYGPPLQFGYQATDTGVTGAPSTEKPYAEVRGFLVSSANNGAGGVLVNTRRGDSDANMTNIITIDAVGDTKFKYSVGFARGGLTLVNGLNSNITVGAGTQTYFAVAGPTGAFSVGGFTGGYDGRLLILYNTVAQAMTIVNEDASGTAINRITTLTGADVVLTNTGGSAATFIYDASATRWILLATQG